MINALSDLKNVFVNGKHYDTLSEFISKNPSGVQEVVIKINEQKQTEPARTVHQNSEKIYKIKVRQYMTKPSSPDFPFHTQWNNDIPMPMRIMVGKILKETKGMYQMELWGQITEETTSVCMCCGRALTNDVSRYFGIGPECGGHGYVNPFSSDKELKTAVKEMNHKLMTEKKWAGWVIKSSIEEWEELK